jgi:hypothetical protein
VHLFVDACDTDFAPIRLASFSSSVCPRTCPARSLCLTMRLLERKPDGDLVFRESTDNDVLAYAILSYTWLANDNKEVSFQDIEAGTGKSKTRWKKIQFCADKAAADRLRYFWIDTCCINKKNSTELSKAINSMFRWYQKAARCYVYLTDVSAHMIVERRLNNALFIRRRALGKVDGLREVGRFRSCLHRHWWTSLA